MIAEIRRLLAAVPFEPFYIVMSSGQRYRVASRDHAQVSPTGGRVGIWFDDDSGITLSTLHITAVEVERVQPV